MGKNYFNEREKQERDFCDREYIPNPYFRPEKKDDCCCIDDMHKFLKILKYNKNLRPGMTDAKFAFIGDNLLFGTNLELYSTWAALGNDNINAPSANFIGFDNCSCGYVNVSSGKLTYPTPLSVTSTAAEIAAQQIDLPVDQVSLCNLDAIAFDYNVAATGFVDELRKLLCHDVHDCDITDCEDCCCSHAVINKIDGYSTVNITAGWLALYQVEYLGNFGNIAVFSNAAAANPTRVYLVCSNSISYFGARPIA